MAYSRLSQNVFTLSELPQARTSTFLSENKINYMKNKSRHGATMKAIELVNKYKKKLTLNLDF